MSQPTASRTPTRRSMFLSTRPVKPTHMNIDFEAELPDVTVQWLTNDGTVASLPIPIQENKQLQIKVSDARGDVTLDVQVTSDETCYVHSLEYDSSELRVVPPFNPNIHQYIYLLPPQQHEAPSLSVSLGATVGTLDSTQQLQYIITESANLEISPSHCVSSGSSYQFTRASDDTQVTISALVSGTPNQDNVADSEGQVVSVPHNTNQLRINPGLSTVCIMSTSGVARIEVKFSLLRSLTAWTDCGFGCCLSHSGAVL